MEGQQDGGTQRDGEPGVWCWAEPRQRGCGAHHILNSFSGCSGGINMA